MLDAELDGALLSAAVGIYEGVPEIAPQVLYQNAEESTSECELQGALEVSSSCT